MYNPLQNAGIFLIKTLFNIYIYLVLLRFILQILRSDFYNPICQFIIKATNPLLLPLRRIIPGLFGVDLAAIVLVLFLQFAQLSCLVFVVTTDFLAFSMSSISGIVVWSIGQMLDQVVSLFTFSIIIYAIISWFPQIGYNPVASILNCICSPVLRFTKKVFPFSIIAGIDIAPLFVLIMLQLLNFLLTEPLIHFGQKMLQLRLHYY